MAGVVAKEGEGRCAANRRRGIIRTYERETERGDGRRRRANNGEERACAEGRRRLQIEHAEATGGRTRATVTMGVEGRQRK
uniref:Uncharacterized protein n=1 Tax=Oryza glumipatula TaxID=40148 RepID=A0A0D9Z6H2_9ORYZ